MAEPPREGSSDLELLKFRLLTEMQDEITTWAKRRFSIVAIVIAIVGTFGFTTLLTQVIQSLVSSNVKASVDNEVGRLADDLENKQAYIERFVDNQLDRLDQSFDRTATRLDSAIERATEQALRLEQTTQEAQDAAEAARETATNTAAQLEQTNQAITLAASAADKLNADYKTLRETYGDFGQIVFERLNKTEAVFAKNTIRVEGLQDRITQIESEFAQFLQNGGLNGLKLDVLFANFSEAIDDLKRGHEDQMRQFEDNSRSKIVIFVQPGKDLTEDAEDLSEQLRYKGFQTEVWTTEREERDEALSNIKYYFTGLDNILRESAEGFVHNPGTGKKADQIIDVLNKIKGYGHIEPVATNFQAADEISVTLTGNVLPSYEVFLIYKTVE